MVPAKVFGQTLIRFCVCAERATDRDIAIAWEIIRTATDKMWGEQLSEIEESSGDEVGQVCLDAAGIEEEEEDVFNNELAAVAIDSDKAPVQRQLIPDRNVAGK